MVKYSCEKLLQQFSHLTKVHCIFHLFHSVRLITWIATSEEEKTDVLRSITTHLSKDQADYEERRFGIACVRGIYSSGDSEFINRLWKECKNSFEVQPYNIIKIENLLLEDNELGRGTFGCVKKGMYVMPSGESIPVAVKIIQENNLVFDLCDLRSEVNIHFLQIHS